jgi:hypothetical protein
MDLADSLAVSRIVLADSLAVGRIVLADSRVVGHRFPVAVQEVPFGEVVARVCNLVVRIVVQTAAVLPIPVRP